MDPVLLLMSDRFSVIFSTNYPVIYYNGIVGMIEN